MKVKDIKKFSFFKVHVKKIYFVIITLLSLILCLVSKGACIILSIVSFIEDTVCILSPNYTRKLYEKDLYIKAFLLGILLGFFVENRDAILNYFI